MSPRVHKFQPLLLTLWSHPPPLKVFFKVPLSRKSEHSPFRWLQPTTVDPAIPVIDADAQLLPDPDPSLCSHHPAHTSAPRSADPRREPHPDFRRSRKRRAQAMFPQVSSSRTDLRSHIDTVRQDVAIVRQDMQEALRQALPQLP